MENGGNLREPNLADRVNIVPKKSLAPFADYSRMSEVERWSMKPGPRAFDQLPVASLPSNAEAAQLYRGVDPPKGFMSSGVPAKAKAFEFAMWEKRPVRDRLAPPSDERRKEVTRHFKGCSPDYSIEID